MTVASQEANNLPLPYNPDDLDDGLGDIRPDELRFPRMAIDHNKVVFYDMLNNMSYESLQCVLLGLVRQRIMFDTNRDDKMQPQCKSLDFTVGFPTLQASNDLDLFPWAGSNFDPDSVPRGENGQFTLPCDRCAYSQWDNQNGNPPRCTELWVIPAMVYNEGSWNGYILTFSKSSLKSIQEYLKWFKARKRGAYSSGTTITLREEKRSGRTYGVAEFKRGNDTDPHMWGEYSDNFRAARMALQSMSGSFVTDDESDTEESHAMATPSDNTVGGAMPADPWDVPDSDWPQSSPGPAPSSPAPPAAPVTPPPPPAVQQPTQQSAPAPTAVPNTDVPVASSTNDLPF